MMWDGLKGSEVPQSGKKGLTAAEILQLPKFRYPIRLPDFLLLAFHLRRIQHQFSWIIHEFKN